MSYFRRDVLSRGSTREISKFKMTTSTSASILNYRHSQRWGASTLFYTLSGGGCISEDGLPPGIRLGTAPAPGAGEEAGGRTGWGFRGTAAWRGRGRPLPVPSPGVIATTVHCPGEPGGKAVFSTQHGLPHTEVRETASHPPFASFASSCGRPAILHIRKSVVPPAAAPRTK
ncbi:hypothetical protein BN140_3049 [Methanoculleus bourgensis MS2]|uniref:Uncharacterized protein n=1 Tax=Methanoculleus bourgensis (strain ATCC 43281 / DSM 3045 / OCM 15 / MS2) TaxID=1201294 RepID=W6PPP4_METBM|nr:hypothetical protein BN140_3049 [Methanoculleus bourgensis MS2]